MSMRFLKHMIIILFLNNQTIMKEEQLKNQEGGVINSSNPENLFIMDYTKEQLIDLCIKYFNTIRSLKDKNKNLTEKNEFYREEIQRINRKAEQRKKDTDYQRKTVTLYKRVLAKLVWCEGDF